MFYECAYCEKCGRCIGCELKPSYDGSWRPSQYMPKNHQSAASNSAADTEGGV